jgi:hypothetical protein
MAELKPYTSRLDECRRRGIPRTTPPPPEYQTYDEWYRNVRGINLATGKRDLKSYGDWIAERIERGLPSDAPPPEGYETEADWFRRVRAIDPETGKPLENPMIKPTRPTPSGGGAPSATLSQTAQTPTGPSGFFRRALARAGTVASRLGAIGKVFRNGSPVLSAVSSILHAIVEGQELQKEQPPSNEVRADAVAVQKAIGRSSQGPRIG